MQLELFNIRSNDAPQKGKATVLADGPVKTNAGGTTNTEKSTRDDFMSSLAMVSKENQDRSGDIPAAEHGPDQIPDSDDLTNLSDILEEITREWPAGKRPVDFPGVGGELQDLKGPGSKGPHTGHRLENPGGGNLALTATGKEEHALVRAWQGTVGFTAGLMKRLNSAQKPDGAQPRVQNDTKAATDAVSLKTTAASIAKLPEDSGNRGTGTKFFTMDDTRPVTGGSTTVKGAAIRDGKGNGFGSGKVSGRPAGLLADVLKTSQKAAGAQALPLRSAGKNEETGIEKIAAVKIETKMTRTVAAEGNRPTGELLPENKAAGQNPSAGQKLSDSLPKSAAISTLSEKDPKDGVTGLKPKMADTVPGRGRAAGRMAIENEPAGNRNPGTWNAAGKHSESGTRVPFSANSPGKGQGLAQKSSRFQNAAERQGPQGLRHPAEAEGEKSATAVERKVLLNKDANMAHKEKSGTDTPSGQMARDLVKDVARDLKGPEQPRFETAAARMKPLENTPVTPNGQSSPAVSVPLETGKSYMDRTLQARVLGQIVDKMRLSSKKGGHEIRINLRPETLGQIQLKVLTQDHSITVRMVADTPAAKEIIENNLGQLRADLNAQGLSVERLDVDVFTANDPGGREQAEKRSSFNRVGAGTAEHAEEDGDRTDRIRQMHAAEDAADGGTLIGVFA